MGSGHYSGWIEGWFALSETWGRPPVLLSFPYLVVHWCAFALLFFYCVSSPCLVLHDIYLHPFRIVVFIGSLCRYCELGSELH